MSRSANASASDVETLQEREHKFEVVDSFTVPDLNSVLPEGGHAAHRESVVLNAVYFDTEDRDLLGSGITLRRRTGGSDAGWHLKSPEDKPGVRTESHAALGSDETSIPVEIEQLVADQIDNRILRPVLRIRTERIVTDLFGDNGKLLVEVADDHVFALRLADLGVTTWREIEIEERAVARTTVELLEELLCARGARRASYPSKAARGLGDEAPAVTPTDRIDPLAAQLRMQLAELVTHEAGMREGREDAVHRMRVATRRLRSCLRTFRSAFADEPTRHLVADLQWLGDHLGAERDAEVIRGRIARDLGELSPDQALGPVRASLESRGSGEITAAHHALMIAMSSSRYRLLLDELAAFSNKPPFRSSRRGNRWLQRRLKKAVRQTEGLVERANLLNGSERESALHEVRKSAKHVRYAAETLTPVYGGKARRIARQFESVQEVLGEHHDAIVTRRVFREEGARAGVRSGENGFTYGVLFAREDARAAAAESVFATAWNRARKGGAHRWINS